MFNPFPFVNSITFWDKSQSHGQQQLDHPPPPPQHFFFFFFFFFFLLTICEWANTASIIIALPTLAPVACRTHVKLRRADERHPSEENNNNAPRETRTHSHTDQDKEKDEDKTSHRRRENEYRHWILRLLLEIHRLNREERMNTFQKKTTKSVAPEETIRFHFTSFRFRFPQLREHPEAAALIKSLLWHFEKVPLFLKSVKTDKPELETTGTEASARLDAHGFVRTSVEVSLWILLN